MDVPPEVAQAALALTGRPCRATPLRGLSGASAVELAGPRARIVAKGPVGPAEHHVTVHLAPVLRQRGVRLGRCLEVVERADGPWLLLEHLPGDWPRERWGADPEALAVLRALHRLDPTLLDGVPGRFRPVWDDDASRLAQDVLGLHGLSGLQHRADPLLEPVAVVSADPNPRNWRRDSAGRLCLVDQGRLTLARPELDLAILLPGLPSREEAAAAVAAYGGGDVDLVLLAKAWSIVELAADPHGRDVVAGLAGDVRRWCATVLG